jgi:predicted subunit of tRNA(5-methylaminomethyl-2-thiouridylate) methyltransferase
MAEIVLLFSGGADSALAAVRLLDTHEKVQLLTVRHGLELWIGRSARLAARLRQRYGAGRVEHRIVRSRALLDAAAGGTLLRPEHLAYPGVLVLAERAALHGAAVACCRALGIREVADGSTARQADVAPPQRRDSLEAFRAFHARFGVRYFCPVYEEASSAAALAALGLLSPEDRYVPDGAAATGTIALELLRLARSKLRNRLHPVFLVESALQALGLVTRRYPPPAGRQRARLAREREVLARALERVAVALDRGRGPVVE